MILCPKEVITINDKDPPWMNNKMKVLIFKNCLKINNSASLSHFEKIEDALRQNIEISKLKYFSKLPTKLTCHKINPNPGLHY